MTKSIKIGKQIYGYTVCLAAVITFLIAITSLMNAMIDLKDPLHAGWNQPGSPSLASFENYKMDVMKYLPKNEGSTITYPSDQTLRMMFVAAKSDKIQTAEHQANRSIIIGGFLIVISAALFLIHWRWVQKEISPIIIQESNMSYAD
jgi:hypothetical protein